MLAWIINNKGLGEAANNKICHRGNQASPSFRLADTSEQVAFLLICNLHLAKNSGVDLAVAEIRESGSWEVRRSP